MLHLHAPETLTPTALEYEFIGHATQAPEAVAPTVTRYVPAEQSEHPIEPLAALYFPATHAGQTPPEPVYPALQVQAAIAELDSAEFEFAGQVEQVDKALAPATAEYVLVGQPVQKDTEYAPVGTGWYVPAGQSEQVAFPVVGLYFPATHDVQDGPLGPVNPALQIQS